MNLYILTILFQAARAELMDGVNLVGGCILNSDIEIRNVPRIWI